MKNLTKKNLLDQIQSKPELNVSLEAKNLRLLASPSGPVNVLSSEDMAKFDIKKIISSFKTEEGK